MIFTDITQLYQPRVQENADLVQTTLRQLKDTVDVSKGTALYDLVVRPVSVLVSLTEENVARARNAGSLLRISQDPDYADDDMVDELLSNYLITRNAGSKAGGSVTVSLSDSRVTAIPRGTVFTSGSLTFYSTDSYIGVTEAGMVSSATDRLIKPIGGGLYGFTVEVEAEADGSEYRLIQNDMLAITSPPSNYVSSWASVDFTDGANAETTTELIARLPAGLANRSPGNSVNIKAMITDYTPTTKHVSIVGYGSPEMSRDKENLFNTSYGGKTDIFVQTDVAPTTTRLTKTATLINAATKSWQIFLDKDDFAGMYKIKAIRRGDQLESLGELAITTEVRAADDTAGTDNHTVGSLEQAAFSRYQTATVEFIDTDTSTAALTPLVSTNTYYVDLIGMPTIAAIQDNIFNDDDVSNPRYDDLVKAPVPCLVSISCTVKLRSGESFDSQAAKQAIADRINGLGFRSTLSSAYVVDVLQGLLDVNSYVVLPLDMLGELINPATGDSELHRASAELIIDEDAENGITSNTMMFFCSASDIDIYTQAE